MLFLEKKKMTEETKCVSKKECVGELIRLCGVCVCVCRARQRLDCAARCFLTRGPLLSPLLKETNRPRVYMSWAEVPCLCAYLSVSYWDESEFSLAKIIRIYESRCAVSGRPEALHAHTQAE